MEYIKDKEKFRIAFSGASGTGKTTLAKEVSKMYSIPFKSSSFSDLVPETKHMTHAHMLNQPTPIKMNQDMDLVHYRDVLYDNNPVMVTDRCFLDNIAYIIHKYDDTKDLDNVLCELISKLVEKFDVLFLLAYTPSMVKSWGVQDNNKRILSGWFQYKISLIMQDIILNHPLVECVEQVDVDFGYSVVDVFIGGNKLRVVEINDTSKILRLHIIKDVLDEFEKTRYKEK